MFVILLRLTVLIDSIKSNGNVEVSIELLIGINSFDKNVYDYLTILICSSHLGGIF